MNKEHISVAETCWGQHMPPLPLPHPPFCFNGSAEAKLEESEFLKNYKIPTCQMIFSEFQK